MAEQDQTLERPFLKRRDTFLEALDGLADASEPRAIHFLRVSTRRLVEALKLEARAGSKGLKRAGRAAKEVRQRLGELRELDVSLGLLAGLRTEVEPAGLEVEQGLAVLEAQLLEAREAQRRKTLKRLPLERLEKVRQRVLGVRLAELPEAGDPQAGLQAQEEALRWNEVLTQLKVLSAASPAEDALHLLRIKVKQLRYLIEMDERRETAHVLEPLRQAQERLGLHRDWWSLLERCRRFRKALPGGRRHHPARQGLLRVAPLLSARVVEQLAALRALEPLIEQARQARALDLCAPTG